MLSKLCQLCQVISRRPVTVNGKLPALDDVRAEIKQDYHHAVEDWKSSLPRKVVSRYVSKFLSYTRHMNGDFELRYSCFNCNQCTKLHTCLFVSGSGKTSRKCGRTTWHPYCARGRLALRS